jgi:hypothetical protein
MSIVTLKRKTNTQYNNMSVGVKQFSLNGGYRSLTYVGKSAQQDHYPRTLMNQNIVRGHGGCCGNYNQPPIVYSNDTVSFQDSSVIKPSVLNTRGMLQTRFRWITRPQPFATVKPDSNLNLNNSSDRTDTVKNKAIACSPTITTLPIPVNKPSCNKCEVMKTPDYGSNSIIQPTSSVNITKSNPYLTQDDVLQRKKLLCSEVPRMDKVYVPFNTSNTPFACSNA